MNIDADTLKRWLPWVLIALVALASAGGVSPNQPGPRIVLLVRETSDVTPQLANAETLLRDGPAADYLASKKHKLLILSDDMPLPSSAPGAVKIGFERARLQLPAVAVCVPGADDRGVLGVEKIAPTASAEDVLAIVRKYGG
jgi:hypothetical protein